MTLLVIRRAVAWFFPWSPGSQEQNDREARRDCKNRECCGVRARDIENKSGPHRAHGLPTAYERFGCAAYGPERASTEIVSYCNRGDDEQRPRIDYIRFRR